MPQFPRSLTLTCAGAIAAACGAPSAQAQLRIAAWNISNYGGGRDADLKTCLYATYQGRALAPDAIMTQEFLSASAVANFKTILNTANGSPGDWEAVTFTNGPDTDSAFFYRTSKVTFLNTSGTGEGVIAVTGGDTSGPPRNVMRYDIRPVGYSADSTVTALYSVHMKSGSASGDQNRRRIEAERIRANMETLPAAWNFAIGGDFNIQSSSQSAYQYLIGTVPTSRTRYIDPIATPGSWNNNGAYRFVHTQDPIGAGGMDDRHDQILLSEGLVDGAGLEYVGNPGVAFSTTTWNDANHSYRCWGNDGTSYDTSLTVAGNQNVGPAIAQALINAAAGAGHLPVYLDMKVPAEVASDQHIDFGRVPLNSAAEQSLHVRNDGDTALWTAPGIADLHYTLSASGGFGAPGGEFAASAGDPAQAHLVTMDTSTPGVKSGTIVIASDAPDEPTRVVVVLGEVTACRADWNNDGYLDAFDYDDFVSEFFTYVLTGAGSPDYNADGYVDAFDYDDFVSEFFGGCGE